MAVTRAATSKNYAAIAKSKIYKPSAAPERGLSILVYARNKKGKTRFCATAPDVLILDPEYGADQLTALDPSVWPITRWQDLDEVYRYLSTERHPFKFVAFDGLTRFSNMSLRFVMEQAEESDLSRKPGMVQQRDYGKSGELMKALMYNFHNLPIGVIYTAQERQIEGEFAEEDDDAEAAATQYVPDLPKGVRSTVNSVVDVIGRLYTIRTDDKEGNPVIRRRLWLSPSSIYDTGYRSEFILPDYLTTPTVPRLINLINNGKKDK